MQVGSLAASNIMTVCTNHHRQLHYGKDVSVEIGKTGFTVVIAGVTVEIPKFKVNISFEPSPSQSVVSLYHDRYRRENLRLPACEPSS